MKFIRNIFSRSSDTEAKSNTPNSARSPVAKNAEQKQNKPQNDLSEATYGQELISSLSNNKRQIPAAKRMAVLLDLEQIDWPTVSNDVGSLDKRLLIRSYQKDGHLFDTMCDALSDESTIFSICQATCSARIRAKLVEKISSDERLKQLEKVCKSSDKTSYRIVREKREIIKQEAAHKQAIIDAQNTFLEQLTQHAERTVNRDYEFKLNSFARKFEDLNVNASPQWSSEAEGLIGRCRKNLQQHTDVDTEKNDVTTDADVDHTAVHQATTATATTTPANLQKRALQDQLMEELIALINTLLSPEVLTDGSLLAEHAEKFNDVQDNWQKNVNTAEDDTNADLQSQQFDLLKNTLSAFLVGFGNDEKLIHALQHTVSSSDSESRQDTNKSELETAISVLKTYLKPLSDASLRTFNIQTPAHAQLKKLKSAHKAILTKESEENKAIVSMIRRGQTAVSHGQLKKAQGIRYSIEQKIGIKSDKAVDSASTDAHLPDKLSAYTQKQWLQFLEDLQKLIDWQSYAIIPKCEKLVADMQALAESPLPAEAQATKIKQLQEQWRSMTKGSANAVQNLWEQFKAASDIAYETCKKHYDALDSERELHLKDKETLIQQLNEYLDQYDWENAQWNKVAELLRTSKQAWRDIGAVSRKEHKSVQMRFDTVLAAIEEKLFAYYDGNKQEKERLVKSVEALTGNTDLQQAIDVTIKFQKQWKDIGPCLARDDKTLWTHFRRHCDAIFAKRDAERADQRAVYDTAIKQAEAVIADLNDIANADVAEFESKARQTDDIRDRFDTIENLPKGKDTALKNQMHKQLDAIVKRLSTVKTEKNASMWKMLFEINASINSLAASARDAEQTNAQGDIGDLETHIQSLKAINKGHKDRLLLKLSQLRENKVSDDDTAARMLCIRAEITSDTETPASDKNLRMQYQVEQLQNGLGRTNGTDSAEHLAQSWLALPLLDVDHYDALQQRFDQSWKKLR